MSELIWVFEVYYINGKWYIYFVVSNYKIICDEFYYYCMFVFENQYMDLMNIDWIEKG